MITKLFIEKHKNTIKWDLVEHSPIKEVIKVTKRLDRKGNYLDSVSKNIIKSNEIFWYPFSEIDTIITCKEAKTNPTYSVFNDAYVTQYRTNKNSVESPFRTGLNVESNVSLFNS